MREDALWQREALALWYVMRDGTGPESITDVDWWYETRVGPARLPAVVDSHARLSSATANSRVVDLL